MTLRLRTGGSSGRAARLSDHIDLRRAIVLCHTCATWRMGLRWQKKHGYHRLGGYKATDTCDLCGTHALCGVYIREESKMAEEAREAVEIDKRWQAKGPASGLVVM